MLDQPTLIAIVVALALALAARRWTALRVVVEPHEAALLVRNGRDRGALAPGVHRFLFGTVRVVRFDLREGLQRVAGQEVLTRDRVPVKVTLLVRRRVADATRAHRAVQDVDAHVHAAVQVAMREVVAALDLEQLLAERADLGARLGAGLRAALAEAGLELVAAAVLDVMVAGELKRAFGDVARARAEGLAKLERARGEAAALRKLANAARLLREHEGLERLKTLEVAARAAESSQNTLVLGLDDRGRALRDA